MCVKLIFNQLNNKLLKENQTKKRFTCFNNILHICKKKQK